MCAPLSCQTVPYLPAAGSYRHAAPWSPLRVFLKINGAWRGGGEGFQLGFSVSTFKTHRPNSRFVLASHVFVAYLSLRFFFFLSMGQQKFKYYKLLVAEWRKTSVQGVGRHVYPTPHPSSHPSPCFYLTLDHKHRFKNKSWDRCLPHSRYSINVFNEKRTSTNCRAKRIQRIQNPGENK